MLDNENYAGRALEGMPRTVLFDQPEVPRRIYDRVCVRTPCSNDGVGHPVEVGTGEQRIIRISPRENEIVAVLRHVKCDGVGSNCWDYGPKARSGA